MYICIDNSFLFFYRYNSGGKCFSQVHTKHLTVTIDAFTIHNSLWQGKKVHLPSKKDMALVIYRVAMHNMARKWLR